LRLAYLKGNEMKSNITHAPRIANTAIKPTGTVKTKATTRIFRKTLTVNEDQRVLAAIAKYHELMTAPAPANAKKAKHGGRNAS
jgi:hypothetical protein